MTTHPARPSTPDSALPLVEILPVLLRRGALIQKPMTHASRIATSAVLL